MIELKSLMFSYTKNGPLVLDDLSLEIKEQGAYMILGSNGSGKSTLMDVVTGFKQPKKGQALINGVDIYSNTKAQQEAGRIISYMPSSLRFPDHLYVDSIIGLYSGPYSKGRLLKDTGIDSLLNKKYSELSDGFKTRLALSICLSRGAYIFLDEPLKSQDEELKGLFPTLLREHALGRTIVVCSPNDISGVEWKSCYKMEKGSLKRC